MPPLEFSFSEFFREIDAILNIAGEDFLDKSTVQFVFPALKSTLANIRSATAGRVYEWEVQEAFPIRTAISCGGYQPDWNGEHNVFAEISSIWEISPLGDHHPKAQAGRRFALLGKASTKIRILKKLNENRAEELVVWHMEIGDDNSPGCHFHIHLPSEHIDVPRLPALMATPMVALEYVLGEIFQDDWKKATFRDTYDVQIWRSIQKKRIIRVIDWQKNTLETTSGSPWIALKVLKPNSDLFYG